LIEFSSDIHIALLNGFVGQFLDTVELLSIHFKGLEKVLWASESFATDSNDLTIWEFIVHFEGRAVLSLLESGFVINSNKRGLFLDVSHDFHFSGGSEIISSFCEELGHETSKISSGKLDSGYCMRD